MQRYEVIWDGDSEDIKICTTGSSRIVLVNFKKEDLLKIKKRLLNLIKFNSGIYILEGEGEKEERCIYIGESDDVWKRTNYHIKNKFWIDNISIILSADPFNGFNKTEMHWIEKELIKEFEYLSNTEIKSTIEPLNQSKGFVRDIVWFQEETLKNDLVYIKRALYFIGKDYWISSIQDDESSDELQNINKNIIAKNWIEVEPIIREKRKVKVTGKFEFNIEKGIIRAYEENNFQGKVAGSRSNFEHFDYLLKKYKTAGKLEGHFNNLTGEYNVKVIKEIHLKPSTITVFTRAGISSGWYFWKDKKGKLIHNYRT